ncbi:MAG: OmpA family protein [Planctomycetota bacterium]
MSGAIEPASEAGPDGEGPGARRPTEVFVAETAARQSIDVAPALGTTVVRLRGARPIHVLELEGQRHFFPEGRLLDPDAGLAPLGAALEGARARPEDLLLVAGHGPSDEVAAGRAQVVAALLAGDREAYAAAAAHAGVREWQRLLAWTARARGFACDPGEPDGIVGRRTRAALRTFRERAGVAPGPEDAPAAADWQAWAGLQAEELARGLGRGPAELAATQAALRFVPARAVSCGEAWPRDVVRIRDHRVLACARVDVLSFIAADAPRLDCHAGSPAGSCEPKRCDLYRKGKYRCVDCAPAPAPPGPPPRRKVHLLEMEDLSFNFDSAVMRPVPRADADAPPSQDRITGLAAIKTALELVELFPEKRLLVAGHTDTAGDAGYNQRLASSRAQGVLAYLRGDRAGWAKVCQARFQVEDWQGILAWIAERFAWDTHPGPITNQSNEPSRLALRRFRLRYSAEFPEDIPERGPLAERDWAAFYDLYELELQALLRRDAAGVAALRARLQPLAPPAVGCGEHFPVEDLGDGQRSAANRRVELLFFDHGEEPALACHAGDRCDPGRCDLYPRGKSYDLERLPVEVERLLPPIEVLLHTGKVPDAELPDELLIEDLAAGTTRALPLAQTGDTGDGNRVFRFFPQDLPDSVLLRWRRPTGILHVAGPCRPLELSRSLHQGDYQGAPGLRDEREARTPLHPVTVELDPELDAEADRLARGADGRA